MVRFESRSADIVAAHGGRTLKTLGDEIMFVTADPESGAEVALRLLSEQDDVIPAMRAGLATGQVVTRRGDVYGTTVNLASRLTDEALPGTVLCDVTTAAALAGHDGFLLSRSPSARCAASAGWRPSRCSATPTRCSERPLRPPVAAWSAGGDGVRRPAYPGRMSRGPVAEDDPGISEPLLRALGREGDRRHHVTDGREALSAALGGRTDLLVLDLGLPGMDGLGRVPTCAAAGARCRCSSSPRAPTSPTWWWGSTPGPTTTSGSPS